MNLSYGDYQNGGLNNISSFGKKLDNYVTNKVYVPEPEINIPLETHLKYTPELQLNVQKEKPNASMFTTQDIYNGWTLARQNELKRVKKGIIYDPNHPDNYTLSNIPDIEDIVVDKTQEYISKGFTYDDLIEGNSMSKFGFHLPFNVDQNNELKKENGVDDLLKSGGFIEKDKDILLSNYGINENGDNLLTSGVKNN